MALMTTYNPMPISFTHGEGVWLYDEEGKKYLDALNKIEEIKHVFSIDEKNEMRKAAIMEQAEQQMQKQKEQKD